MEINSNHEDDSPCSLKTETHHLHRSSQSRWLHSTLSEVDDKVKTILDLIEGDGDTFAMRAEMYYQKRPQLIKMVQDLHRSYHALAGKHDLLKSHDSSIKPSKGRLYSNQNHGISIAPPNFDTESPEEFSPYGSDSDMSSLEFHSPENLVPDEKIGNLTMQENEQKAVGEKASPTKEEESKILKDNSGIIPRQEVSSCNSSTRHEIGEAVQTNEHETRILRDRNETNDRSPRHEEGASKGKKPRRKTLIRKLFCMAQIKRN